MQESSTKIRVGVLRGGTGEEYEHSLKRGGDMVSYIREKFEDTYDVLDILIDKDGVWHMQGLPILPTYLIHKVDVVWNTTQPSWNHILNSLSVPVVGQASFSHSIVERRDKLSEHMKNIDVKMPRHFIIPAYQKDFDARPNDYSVGGDELEIFAVKKSKEIHNKFGSPWIVRSFTHDSNTAIHIAKTFPQLVNAVLDIAKSGKSILVEEMITGKIASVHTIPSFRGADMYTLLSGNLATNQKEKLTDLACFIHQHLGASHYLKSSFTIHPRGDIYLIHTDLTPNFKEHSDLYKSCEKIGITTKDLFEHILNQVRV